MSTGPKNTGAAVNRIASRAALLYIFSVCIQKTRRVVLWTQSGLPPAGTPERSALPGFSFRGGNCARWWFQKRSAIICYNRAGDVCCQEEVIRAFVGDEGIGLTWSKERSVDSVVESMLSNLTL